MVSLATKKDFVIVSVIGILFGLLLLPVLENIQPPQWELNFRNAAFLVTGFFIFANFALWVGGLLGAKLPAVWQFVKFGAVGSLNATLDFGILNLLSLIFKVYSGALLVVFNIISIGLAIINSYSLNKFWTFRNHSAVKATEVTRFLLVSALTIFLNSTIVYVLTTTFGAPAEISEPVWENIAKIIAVPITLVVNFFGLKYVVFKTF